jgi:hypothetical protein
LGAPGVNADAFALMVGSHAHDALFGLGVHDDGLGAFTLLGSATGHQVDPVAFAGFGKTWCRLSSIGSL